MDIPAQCTNFNHCNLLNNLYESLFLDYMAKTTDQTPQHERERSNDHNSDRSNWKKKYSHYINVFKNVIKAPSATSTTETRNKDGIAEHPESFNRVESLKSHHVNPGLYKMTSSKCADNNQGNFIHKFTSKK